jgi:hypothetical protein
MPPPRPACSCFADVTPRPGFDAASCSVMNNLSELVVRHLEKDIALKLKTRDNDVLKVGACCS